jgi:ribonuclease H2 subunit A
VTELECERRGLTADSKALSADTRQRLWDAFEEHADLCYSSATLSPQDISANMLRRIPVNLNQQAQDATIGLIRDALDRGINVREVGSVLQCYIGPD